MPYLYAEIKQVGRKTLRINPIATPIFLVHHSFASFARSEAGSIFLCQITVAGEETDDGGCDTALQQYTICNFSHSLHSASEDAIHKIT